MIVTASSSQGSYRVEAKAVISSLKKHGYPSMHIDLEVLVSNVDAKLHLVFRSKNPFL